MRSYPRWLFGSAAVANLTVALLLLFLRPLVGPLIDLDPIAGSNLVLVNLTGEFIGLFGVTYALIASDPVKYRAFIPIGAIGKLGAALSATLPWLAGEISPSIPLLISADVVYALLFLDYLRRTAARQ